MKKYLALTQQTCSWLLTHPAILTALHSGLAISDLDVFTKAEFSAGPRRIVGTPDGQLVAAWNREYLSGTGKEAWGICLLTGPFGLLELPNISRQVLERQIYIFSQRLQSLIIDGDFIHRTWPNGSQTCLAGPGTDARQYSVCYFEGGPGYAGLTANTKSFGVRLTKACRRGDRCDSRC